jgi:hypothetical protein
MPYSNAITHHQIILNSRKGSHIARKLVHSMNTDASIMQLLFKKKFFDMVTHNEIQRKITAA